MYAAQISVRVVCACGWADRLSLTSGRSPPATVWPLSKQSGNVTNCLPPMPPPLIDQVDEKSYLVDDGRRQMTMAWRLQGPRLRRCRVLQSLHFFLLYFHFFLCFLRAEKTKRNGSVAYSKLLVLLGIVHETKDVLKGRNSCGVGGR